MNEAMEDELTTEWEEIDDAISYVMADIDDLTDEELIVKFKRLRHLSKFCTTLASHVDEILRENVKPGPIDALFDKYQRERTAINGL